MNKLAWIAGLIVALLLASSSPALAVTVTPSPTIHSTVPSNPAAIGGFRYYGSFWIASPTSGAVYNGSRLTLKIDGEISADPALNLVLTYSIDGKEKTPISWQLQPEDHWNPFRGVIDCSVTLPPLGSGEHNVTVFGKMAGDLGSAQATVNFTMDSVRTKPMILLMWC